MREISVQDITPKPNQPRRDFNEGDLNDLAESIKKHGILQPLLVTQKGSAFELVSGERRLRAASIAGLDKVPAITINPGDPRESLTIALVENIQREDLGDIELAVAYKSLNEEFGRTQEEIAVAVGKSRPHVANTIRLLELDKQIRDAIGTGEITAGHARAILSVPSEWRNRFFERMTKEVMTVRKAEVAARAYQKKEKSDSGQSRGKVEVNDDKAVALMLRDIERVLESSLGRRCLVSRNNNGKGKLVIEFYSDRDLEGLVEKLRGN